MCDPARAADNRLAVRIVEAGTLVDGREPSQGSGWSAGPERNSWLARMRDRARGGRCAPDRCPRGQSHVQHPLGDAWPVADGLKKTDMTPNLPPDGASTGAAWSSGWSLADEPRCVALTMAYPRVTETHNAASQGSSQRALVSVIANLFDRVIARVLESGRRCGPVTRPPPPALTAPGRAMAMLAELCTRMRPPAR